jgi:hypothetical protein
LVGHLVHRISSWVGEVESSIENTGEAVTRQQDQITSRLLVVLVVAVNVVVCGALTTVFAVTRAGDAEPYAGVGLGSPVTTTEQDGGELVPSQPEFPTTESTTESTFPTTTTTTVDEGFREVTGPGGMTTYIPENWPTKVAPGPGAMQADDPAGTTRMLRYGGSTTDVTDSYDIHADYERQFSANKVNYVSLRLERTTLRGMPAIDWEFEHDTDGVRRHVRSVYWLANGYEYFVYASAPVGIWPETQLILDVMTEYSTP